MTNDDKKQMEKILEKANKESALNALKILMKDHETWKKNHPRPKRNQNEKEQ